MSLKDERDLFFKDWQDGITNLDFPLCADSQFYLLNTILHDSPIHKSLAKTMQDARKVYDEQQTELDIKMKNTNNLSEKQRYENEILSLEVSFWKELYIVFMQNFLKEELISKV